jgi:hypothetical protein
MTSRFTCDASDLVRVRTSLSVIYTVRRGVQHAYYVCKRCKKAERVKRIRPVSTMHLEARSYGSKLLTRVSGEEFIFHLAALRYSCRPC